MEESKSTDTPLSSTQDITKEMGEGHQSEDFEDIEQYQSIIGSIMYAMVSSRPDLATSVGMLSRYLTKPKVGHWEAAKRILRYLNGTRNLSLRYVGNQDIILEGFCDADWGANKDTRKSATGWVFKLAGCVISWKYKLQPTIATSSTQAEYMSMYSAICEAIWIRTMLSELGFEQTSPTTIYVDNQAAIAISKNPESHERTKHFDIKYHWIREQLSMGTFLPVFVKTTEQDADIFTKILPKESFVKHRDNLGMIKSSTGLKGSVEVYTSGIGHTSQYNSKGNYEEKPSVP
jgi:hypothetical protein